MGRGEELIEQLPRPVRGRPRVPPRWRPARRSGRGSGRRGSSARRRCWWRPGPRRADSRRRHGTQLPRRTAAGRRAGVALGHEPAFGQFGDALATIARPRPVRSTSSDRERDRPRRISSSTRTRASRASSASGPYIDRDDTAPGRRIWATFALDALKYDAMRGQSSGGQFGSAKPAASRSARAPPRRTNGSITARSSRQFAAFGTARDRRSLMSRFADIGAAVIGTGLHRDGPRRAAPPDRRRCPRRPRQHAGARRRASRVAERPRAPTHRSTRSSPTRPSTSSTSPRRTTSTSRRRRPSSRPASTSSARSRWP